MHMHQCIENLTTAEGNSWAGSSPLKIIFGNNIDLAHRILPGYTPPEPLVVFYCDTILRNNLYVFEDKTVKNIFANNGGMLQDATAGGNDPDNEDWFSEITPEDTQFQLDQVAKVHDVKSNLSGRVLPIFSHLSKPKHDIEKYKRRAAAIEWVIDKLFSGCMPKYGPLGKKKSVVFGQKTAWALAGYKNPRGDRQVHEEVPLNSYEASFPLLPELSRRFLLLLEAHQANVMDGGSNGFNSQMALTWRTKGCPPRPRAPPAQGMPDNTTPIPEIPKGIFHHVDGRRPSDKVTPLDHQDYVNAIHDNLEIIVAALNKEFGSNFMDIWVGVTAPGACRSPLPGELHISLEALYCPKDVQYAPDGTKLPKILGHLLHIRNAYSPLYQARVLHNMTAAAEWMSNRIPLGGNIGSSNKERDYRICVWDHDDRDNVNEDSHIFQLSNDRIPLGDDGVVSIAEEMGFLVTNKIMAFIDDFVRAYIIKNKKDDRHYVRWDPKRAMCQSVLNRTDATYGVHDDSSFHHDHEYDVKSGDTVTWGGEVGGEGIARTCPQFFCVPHKSIMNVATMVFSGDGDPSKAGEPTTALTHYLKMPDKKDDEKYPLHTTLLGTRDFHLQLHCQQYTKHGVKALTFGPARRLAMSFRQTCGPADGYAFQHIKRRENIGTICYDHYAPLHPRRAKGVVPPLLMQLLERDKESSPLSPVMETMAATHNPYYNTDECDASPVLADDLDAEEPQAKKGRRVMIPPPAVNYHPPSFAGTDKSEVLVQNYAASIIRTEKTTWPILTSCEFLEPFRKRGIHVTVMTKRKKIKLPAVKKSGTSAKSKRSSRSKESSRKPRKRKTPVVNEVAVNEESVDEDVADLPLAEADWIPMEYGIPLVASPYDNPLKEKPKLMPATRLLPGDICLKSEIREITDNPKTDHYNSPWRHGEGRNCVAGVNSVMLSYKVNSELDNIETMVSQLPTDAEGKRKLNKKELADTIKAILCDTWFGGSGGTGLLSGAYAQPLAKTNATQAPAKGQMHSNQSHDLPQNAIMIRVSERGTVLNLFVDWTPPKGTALCTTSQEELVMFIGLFELNEYIYKKDEEETIKALRQRPGLDDALQHNLGFRLFKHFKFYLKPWSDPTLVYFYDDAPKAIVLHTTGKNTYEFTCPANGSDTNKALADAFFESDQHLTFTGAAVNPEDISETDIENSFNFVATGIHLAPHASADAMSRVMVAGAMRANRLNVSNVNKVHYLEEHVALENCPANKILKPLGIVTRTAPCHIPNRELDPGTAFLMMLCENTFQTRPGAPRISGPKVHLRPMEYFVQNPDMLERMLLSSFMVRFLGNINAIADYIHENGAHENSMRSGSAGAHPLQLFDKKKVSEFADYIYDRTFLGDGNHATVGKLFMTSQYMASLPDYKWNAGYCRDVLKHFATQASALASSLVDHTTSTICAIKFEHAVDMVKEHLDNGIRTAKEKSSSRFPCLQVMLDVDFVVEGKPFGDNTFAVWLYKGYGSDQGFSVYCREYKVEDDVDFLMYKVAEKKKKEKKKKEVMNKNAMTELTNKKTKRKSTGATEEPEITYADYVLKVICGDKNGLDEERKNRLQQPHHKVCSLDHYLVCYLAFMKHSISQMCDDQIVLRGWRRVRCKAAEGCPDWMQNIVTSMYNGKPISAANLEHEMCTIYALCSRSKGTRAHNAPSPLRDFCHPTPSTGLFSSAIKGVFDTVIKRYLALERRNQLFATFGRLEDAFLVFGEAADWTL